MEGLIDLLLSFVEDHSAYNVAGMDHPVVVEVSRQDLTKQFFRGRAHMMPADGVEERLNALYVAGRDGPDVIFIVPAEEVSGADYFDNPHDNPLWREILLHELVHHAQNQQGGETWSCVSRGEAEAYEIGGVYLETLGLPDPMSNRNIWEDLYESC